MYIRHILKQAERSKHKLLLLLLGLLKQAYGYRFSMLNANAQLIGDTRAVRPRPG